MVGMYEYNQPVLLANTKKKLKRNEKKRSLNITHIINWILYKHLPPTFVIYMIANQLPVVAANILCKIALLIHAICTYENELGI